MRAVTPRPPAPAYRPRRVVVRRRERLSPSFVRVTLHVDDPAGMGCCGDDQRVKLLLPGPGGTLDDVPRGDDWWARTRALPEGARPVVRTYTVRRARPGLAEVDLDVVLHLGADGRPTGPGARWAERAEPGDAALLVGPDSVGSGSAWGVEWSPPPRARALVLCGDETAVPAVASVLEGLRPDGPPVVALLEVPFAQDRLPLVAPGRVDLRWSVRDGRPPGSTQEGRVREVLDAVLGPVPPVPVPTGRCTPAPDEDGAEDLLWEVRAGHRGSGGVYVWAAGEAGSLRGLRHHLTRERALPRGSFAVMGYWRVGRAGT